MTGLFRAVVALRGADKDTVERAGHYGFVFGLLLAIAVLFVGAA